MKIYQKEYINTFSLQFLNVLFVLDQQPFDIIAGSGDVSIGTGWSRALVEASYV